MSDTTLYTLITVGCFLGFYLLIILPLQLRAKRKRHKIEEYDHPKKDWATDPADPHYQATYDQSKKEW